MKVVVEKKRIVNDLAHLRRLTVEYDRFLRAGETGEAWEEDAIALIKSHQLSLSQAMVSLKTIDLVAALMREMLSKINVENLTLRVGAPPAAVASAGQEGDDPLGHLISQINLLAKNSPLAMQEKIRFLLVSVLTLFRGLVENEPGGVSDAMMQINLLTSTRESQNLVREIALIARDIYETLNTLSEGIVLDTLAESTEGISEAARKLKGVIIKLEEAAFQNLDQLEELSRRAKGEEGVCDEILTGLRATQQALGELKQNHPDHGDALTEVQTLLGDELGAGAMALKHQFQENAKTFLALIGNQSFQDLTGQTLKKTIVFIESLEIQLMELLQKYRPVLGLATGKGAPVEKPAAQDPAAGQQNQDQVDALLADLGF